MQRQRNNGAYLPIVSFYFFLGCLALVCVVDRESYGSDRCSVLVVTLLSVCCCEVEAT
jgi:hypothetical protein